MTGSSHKLEVLDIPEHCGNAPRKVVIRDLLVALYQRDNAYVLDRLGDDIRWDIIGSDELVGLDAVDSWLNDQPNVSGLHLSTVITHGTECGADGRVVHDDGTEVAFNHVFIFAGHAKTARIKAIRTYRVPLTRDEPR